MCKNKSSKYLKTFKNRPQLIDFPYFLPLREGKTGGSHPSRRIRTTISLTGKIEEKEN